MNKKANMVTDLAFKLFVGVIVVVIIVLFIIAATGKLDILTEKLNGMFGG